MVAALALLVSGSVEAQQPHPVVKVENLSVLTEGPYSRLQFIDAKFDIVNPTQRQQRVGIQVEYCRSSRTQCITNEHRTAILAPGERKSTSGKARVWSAPVKPAYVRVSTYVETHGSPRSFDAARDGFQVVELVNPVDPGVDIQARDISYEGDFNPGGRIQLWSTFVTESTAALLAREPQARARAMYFWCREQRSDSCTPIGESTAPLALGTSSKVGLPYQELPLSLGTGTRYLRVSYRLARSGAEDTSAVSDIEGGSNLSDNDSSNNDAYLRVSTGAPGEYRAFAGLEIDGHNRKKKAKVSLSECQRACSTETAFVCRSVDYAAKDKECRLQEVTRTESGLSSASSPPRAPLTKSPKKKWSHYARPCKLEPHPTKCST